MERQRGINMIRWTCFIVFIAASVQGYCKCGSDLQCFFEMEGTQVIFKCSVTEGDGQCKLLFLRKPLRIRYAEALEHDKAHVLEAKLATHFKHPSNNNRAPMVPKPTVLRVAKSELTRSRYYDKDPVIALSIMKASDYAEDIHLVGMDPFKVFYWTPHQCQVYNRYLASTNGTLFADATGGFVPRFTKVNGEKTHAVFLYVGVINTTAGQFPVAQMVSEAHDTITITGFWLQWQQYGFALPPEVIMDSSRALVTAAILSFTKYKTIEEYADAGMTDEKIDCYVRYDVAHFIKMYSGFLKDAPRLVKVFFLGCLGKLMKMTEKHIIRSFFKDLFIVALFETNGLVKGKQLPSLCQEAKDRLLSLITDSEGEVILETENKENEVEDDGEQVLIHDYTLSATDDVINTWYEWGLEIKNEVLQLMKTTKEQKSKDNGTEINGYRFPTLVDRMVLDIRHLPLFTGVTYHKYNYGRLPGSSASVECEIKKIKNDVFQKQKYRPDVAVQRHIGYLHGRMIVMDDEMNAKERHEEPNLDPQNETNTSPEFPECDESRSQNDYPSKPDCSLSDSFDDKFTQENGYDASVDSSDDSQSLVINSHPKDNKKDDETGHNENSTEAPQVQNDFTNKMRCIACANGQIPSAHRCIRCLKPVHLLEGCSLAIDGTEEGYGEFRVCLECHSNANSEPSVINNSTEDMKCTACADGKIPFTHLCARCKRQIHDLHGCSIVIPNIQGSTVSVRVCLTCKSMSIKDLNEFLSKLCVENWRGLGRKAETKSRGLYTGGNEHKLKDILTLEKTKGLPVLKSGQSRGLKPVRIKDRKICLVHTCPFDSVFQILLAACCDYPSVRERMEEEVAHNEMYALVIDSLENSLRSWTYRLRAEILSKYFPTSRKFEGIEEIDCKDEICNFVRKIFKQMPSWIEKSKCNQGCRERTIVTEVISLPAESLSDNNFSTIFESYILTDMERKCTNVKCSGMEQTTENIIGGPTFAPIVEVEPRGSVAVRVGDTLRIMCRLGTPLQVCRVEIPSTGSILLQPGQEGTDGIDYDGQGLNSGQCGVIINSVQMQQDGLFKCALVPNGSRSEVIGNVTIVVAKPPRRPQLLISKPIEDPSLSDNLKYRHAHGKAITISCSAQAGRPAPNLTIYLDDQPISRGSALVMNQSDGTSMVMQNLTHTLDWTDNGKILRCVVDHIALDQPEESKTELDVVFSPRGVSDPQRFGYVIGHPGIINLTVHGNPKPAFTWYVNGEEIREGLTDKSQRLQTSTARDLGKGTWYVELRIDSVQKSDTEKVYLLNARNDVGAEEYKIVLSTANEPEGLEIDTGYIIGIVVGILVLLLLVSLIIFARATGRWCFAGGSSSRNIGESSDTESAGRYSRSETDGGSGRPRRPRIMLSQLFKRNKDKVGGTDTDTMRTVVTVDDEKIPEATDVTQKNQTAEGGLVYAELDLTQREATPPRRVSEDKTEYAEILYTKPEKETDENTENNKQ